jgi:hypothetical protein
VDAELHTLSLALRTILEPKNDSRSHGPVFPLRQKEGARTAQSPEAGLELEPWSSEQGGGGLATGVPGLRFFANPHIKNLRFCRSGWYRGSIN